jgi:Fe-S cluster assembly ATPase SufC
MLYKFKSKAAGDVIMTSLVGDAILKLTGREPSAQGIFTAAQMPAVIATLEAAVTDDERRRAEAEAEARAEGRTLAPLEGITLRQRAWPLIEMLKRSQAAGEDVVWGV